MEERENTEREAFVIDSDSKAEWALKKIKSAQEERDRLLALADEAERELQEKREKIESDFERDTAYLKGLLCAYMATVPAKETKTQKSYKLLSGSLVLKRGGYEYKRDEAGLCAWLEKSGYSDFVKVEKKGPMGTVETRSLRKRGRKCCHRRDGRNCRGRERGKKAR